MRVLLIAAVLAFAAPAQAEVINQAGNAVIGGAGQIAQFGVRTGTGLAHLGWNIVTFPLTWIAPQPRYAERRRYR